MRKVIIEFRYDDRGHRYLSFPGTDMNGALQWAVEVLWKSDNIHLYYNGVYSVGDDEVSFDAHNIWITKKEMDQMMSIDKWEDIVWVNGIPPLLADK